jgi:hypothetical protein
MFVEWVRSCYQSRWRVWSDSEESVRGRYYLVPHTKELMPLVPAFPGPTIFTSARWHDRNFRLEQPPLGEVLGAYQTWDPGTPPVRRPRPIIVGSADCISNGEPIAQGLALGDAKRFLGWPALCVAQDPLDDWGWAANVYLCEVQAWWAERLTENNQFIFGGLVAALELQFPGATIAHFDETTLYPPIWCIHHALYSVVIYSPTQNTTQALIEVLQGIQAPAEVGGFGSTALWYAQGLRGLNFLSTIGGGNAEPLLLIGYSYGGASAQCAAGIARQSNAQRPIRFLTFGSPRPGDSRLKGLLDLPTRGVCLANDNDAYTAIPPDLDTVLPVQLPLGVNLLNFTRWQAANEVWQLRENGVVLRNVNPTLTSQEIIDLLTLVWETGTLFGYPGHLIEEYLRRLRLRCPAGKAVAGGAVGLRFLPVRGVGLTGYRLAVGRVGLTAPTFKGAVGLLAPRLAKGAVGLRALEVPSATSAIALYAPPVAAGRVGLFAPWVLPEQNGAIALYAPPVAAGQVGLVAAQIGAGQVGLVAPAVAAGQFAGVGLVAPAVAAGRLGLRAPVAGRGAVGLKAPASATTSAARVGLIGYHIPAGRLGLKEGRSMTVPPDVIASGAVAGTLAGSAGTSDTTLTLTSISGGIPPYPFMATVGGTENVLITNVSGNVLTVQRGFNSTAVSHAAGELVQTVNWIWDYQHGATTTYFADGLYLFQGGPSGTHTINSLLQKMPGIQWNAQAAFVPNLTQASFCAGGMVIGQSGTTTRVFFLLGSTAASSISVVRFTSPTAIGTSVYTLGVAPQFWCCPFNMRIINNGTLLQYQIGDGEVWQTVYSEPWSSSFLGNPDMAGFGVDAYSVAAGTNCKEWIVGKGIPPS